ncbi:DUF1540 domain-containing protein [Fodinisporobacter ferrooxydans]|uniref:DUF1540 domain-containing protein n=1 Tax=Fodinisporobacter ferrooxydans TaxID=2901836 RepID=A0ABY4CDG9_9BACL|nr:DUF1540 domain-containing protein [Alicyclobacillaceae bacterium MYW30-H2]
MPYVQVVCTVSNCKYWGNGNVCNADKILVTSDQIGTIYPNSIDASQADMIVAESGTTPVSFCESTCCKTFETKQ